MFNPRTRGTWSVDHHGKPFILPGIGGSFTRFGHVEVLYVTELVGIVLIYFGFRFNVGGGRESTKVALEAAT